MKTGRIIKVSGPLVVAEGLQEASMFDVVRVGPQRLVGEIIEMRGDRASIQVYEETAGLGPGDPVESTGAPLSVELGPGLAGTIYDGIQRPLEAIRRQTGPNIPRGIAIPALDRSRRWRFEPLMASGDPAVPGDVLGTVQETVAVTHRILVPPGVSGIISRLEPGDYTVEEIIGAVMSAEGEEHPLALMHHWPVRVGRPVQRKLPPNSPMMTGQRIIDTLFPLAKGGTAAVPGPFGSGKTVVQHQLAKWSDVDVVVYIGCGERGNEMTDVLREFPELKDPRTGESLMTRTVMIANTSDMPVSAREASVYTGIAIAEYYRDMGYAVAVIADSTSRWAEALREMSGRLEEMPGDEGYPAYLSSRIAQFYERSGRVVCLGAEGREGSLTAIGAVSPPGGDISEPVSQATLRIVKVFWGLDSQLAYRRHFPAINWLLSYSLYWETLTPWLEAHVHRDFKRQRDTVMGLLQAEAELEEIVRLVGADALSPPDRLTLETTRMLREDFLQQNAFSDTDAYSSFDKQFRLLELILACHRLTLAALERGCSLEALLGIPARQRIARAKDITDYDGAYAAIGDALQEELRRLEEEANKAYDS